MKTQFQLNDLKQIKYLNSEDLKKLLPCVNFIGLEEQSIILIDNKPFTAKTYCYKNIEDVKSYLNKYMGQTVLIYNYNHNPFMINSGYEQHINNGSIINIQIQKNNEIDSILINCDCDCELSCNFTNNEDVNKCYKSFMFRMFVQEEISGDKYKECNDVKCVIDKIENSLKEVNNEN